MFKTHKSNAVLLHMVRDMEFFVAVGRCVKLWD